ncbi:MULTISPECIES: stalk domain-containing protein [Paenibacillus]|uniref:stalk domain-containing protein n=1 Tax=Paenibacillus TaxID=44249 RepID=UPI0002EBDCFC|nr:MULTISPECIES: stalk domain-containing protein [Paenibacillus]KKD54601.1 copper amine oxidase [Paenibacillus sp. ICGEB2008]MBE3647483.1 TolC family protein [Paenibacillus polymyxa]MDU8673335.1 stalk domain-containing protein [Paenibacillus polymyxa]MDU8698241.1 stalk domain-containing protein [Paenibacillus polymyxa]MEE4578289.1 stalk domain-containing protein [Paenibacillus polymyxa]
MKRFGVALLSTLVLTSAFANLAGAQSGDIKVIINGVTQQYTQSPIVSQNTTLVPLRGVFESLGAQVEWDSKAKKVIASKNDDTLTLNIGSKLAYKNSNPVQLDAATQIQKGQVLVPLRFVSQSLGAKVNWDQATRTVTISNQANGSATDTNSLSSKPLTAPVTKVTYDTYYNDSLAYDDAVKLAIADSTSVKTGEVSIDQAGKIMKETGKNIDFVPAEAGDEAQDKAFKGYAQTNLNYEAAKKNLEMTKESIEYNVKDLYNKLLQKQNAVKLAALNIEDSERKLKVVQIKRDNQMSSDYEVTQATNQLTQNQAALDKAKKDLDSAYVSLNQLIGYKPEQRYELKDKPVYSEFKDNVETKVSQVLTSSTAIWLSEQKVDLAELSLKLYNFSTPGNTPYEAEQLNVEKAQYATEGTKRQLEEAVRTIYNNIKALESQYSQIQAGLVSARSAADMAKKQFDVGLATELQVYEANLKVTTAEQQAEDIVSSIDTLKLAFNKPWAMQGSAGASAQ